jgi:hypothetical protein
MLSRGPVLFSFSALALFCGLYGAACSSSDPTGGTTGTGGHSGPPGGSIEGAVDAHCGAKSQVTNAAACSPGSSTTSGSGGGATTGATTGAGGSTSASTGGGDENDYGETLLNAEGDDDDCKYHLAWTATDIYQNTDVTFTAVITTKSDKKPVPAGDVNIEAFLNDTHPAPNDSETHVTESPAGTYKIGPMRFDKPGKWTVRFHIHEDCADLTEDSPHGHVAFFVNVP